MVGGDARQWEQSAGLPYKVEWFSGPRPIRRWRKARRIKQLAKEGVIDALYADSWKSVEYLSGKFVFPVISWAHGNEFPNVANKALRIRKAFSKADHILFNSEDTRNRARAFTPETIGYSIVNPPIFKPEEPSRDDLDRTAKIWADHHPRLLSICRLIDWKGLDQAISALAAIRSRYPEAKLVIAGQGNDLDRLKGLAQSLGVSDSVDFIGWVEGGFKTALHRSADLFLQPGRQLVEEREGYGISYVEAALQGLPTIFRQCWRCARGHSTRRKWFGHRPPPTLPM
ncbi:glycosyltransferase [uncultured Cohaesibacter sp.]|uniref:glycosyltransferase n=1 Tax=uncultured Cohaesibacter sp. TaxID=1002546 RepID=UPI0029317D25|nr:glycosyltransferase [uncultured Cohaesibacter sp.]